MKDNGWIDGNDYKDQIRQGFYKKFEEEHRTCEVDFEDLWDACPPSAYIYNNNYYTLEFDTDTTLKDFRNIVNEAIEKYGENSIINIIEDDTPYLEICVRTEIPLDKSINRMVKSMIKRYNWSSSTPEEREILTLEAKINRIRAKKI